MKALAAIGRVPSKVSAAYGASRKALTALAPPGFLIAGNYFGGQPVPHVWYHVALGVAGALGVYTVTNDSPSLNPKGPK